MLDLFRQLLTLPIPVVARVDGATRAGGLGVLGACDVVLASARSTFAFTEVRLGLAPAVISLPLRPLLTATGRRRGTSSPARRSTPRWPREIGLVTAAGDDVDALASDVLDGLRRADRQGLRETKPLTTGDRLRAIDEEGSRHGTAVRAAVRLRRRAVALLRLPRSDAPERPAMTLSPAPAATLLRDRLDHWARIAPRRHRDHFRRHRPSPGGSGAQRILRLAGALRDAGVRPGDRLTVLDLNHLATVELTLAASALGAATVPANFRLSPDQIRYILEDSRPVILFHGAQLADVAAAAGADSLVPRRVVIGGDSDEYEPFLAAGQPDEGSERRPGRRLPRDVHLRHHRHGRRAPSSPTAA